MGLLSLPMQLFVNTICYVPFLYNCIHRRCPVKWKLKSSDLDPFISSSSEANGVFCENRRQALLSTTGPEYMYQHFSSDLDSSSY